MSRVNKYIIHGYPIVAHCDTPKQSATRAGRVVLVDRGVPAHDNTHHHRYVTGWQGREGDSWDDEWTWGHYFVGLDEAQADFRARCERGY